MVSDHGRVTRLDPEILERARVLSAEQGIGLERAMVQLQSPEIHQVQSAQFAAAGIDVDPFEKFFVRLSAQLQAYLDAWAEAAEQMAATFRSAFAHIASIQFEPWQLRHLEGWDEGDVEDASVVGGRVWREWRDEIDDVVVGWSTSTALARANEAEARAEPVGSAEPVRSRCRGDEPSWSAGRARHDAAARAALRVSPRR